MSLFHSLISQPAPTSYSTEYQAVLDYATLQGYTLPSASENEQNNTAVVNAIANGIWDEIDVWWPMKSNANFSTINWKNPGTYNLGLVNSPTYNAATGFTGNGTTSYLTTGWIPNNSGIFLQDSAGFGTRTTVDISGNNNDFGTADGGIIKRLQFNSRRTTNAARASINSDTANLTITNINAIGRYHIERTSSTAVNVLKNGASIGTLSETSSGRSSYALSLLAYNIAGSISLFSNKGIQGYWAGGPLTGLESTFDTILAALYA